MSDVDYTSWVGYIEEIFKANSLKPSLILDLACGTGSICTLMAKKQYEMIGIDLSEDMLACAKEKAMKDNCDILYLQQDMTRFELYGTVDAILCLMDSVNYITDKKSLKRLFKLVNNYLNLEGLFIFDINSRYKLEKILGNEVYYETGDDIAYIWQNSYDKKRSLCSFDLTFFIREGEKYVRHDEYHEERAYDVQDIKKLISETGLEIAAIYDELSFKIPSAKSGRIFFICRKQNKK